MVEKYLWRVGQLALQKSRKRKHFPSLYWKPILSVLATKKSENEVCIYKEHDWCFNCIEGHDPSCDISKCVLTEGDHGKGPTGIEPSKFTCVNIKKLGKFVNPYYAQQLHCACACAELILYHYTTPTFAFTLIYNHSVAQSVPSYAGDISQVWILQDIVQLGEMTEECLI